MSSLPARVLIVGPAFLGDTVFDGALARALRSAGASRIGLVVRPPADALARRMSWVDRVHPFDKGGRDAGPWGLWRVAREIREEGYDMALLSHTSVRSGLLARAAAIPVRRGWSRTGSALLATDTVSRDGLGFVEARLALAGLSSTSDLAGVLPSPEREPRGPRRVGLVLGAHWPTKRWPRERAGELLRMLEAERFRLVLIGSELERPLATGLEAFNPSLWNQCDDRVGGDVDALVQAIGSCDVIIGGDTGPIHIARAMSLPVVALFGPTDEHRHVFSARDQVLSVPVDCRPCSRHGQKRCPRRHHRCLRELGGREVYAALEKTGVS